MPRPPKHHLDRNITYLADGTAVVRVTVTDPATGQRRRILRRSRGSKAEARRLRDQLERDGLPAPPPAPPPSPTLRAWLAEWHATVVTPLLAEYTAINAEVAIRLHLAPALGDHRLADLTPLLIQRFVADQLASGAKVSTVRYRLGILKTALQHAVDLEVLDRNPALRVKLPPVNRPARPALDVAQARALLAAVAGTQLHALLSVGVGLGLRQGEALGLHWSDVDLEAGRLHVRHQNTAPLGRIKVDQDLKTPGSAAVLPLPPSLVAALKAQRARQAQWRLAADAWHGGHELVFTRDDGRPVAPSSLRKQILRACGAAGVPPITFHAARRTCASLLAAAGADPATMMRVMRHRKAAMTLEVYAKANDAQTRAATDAVGRALEG